MEGTSAPFGQTAQEKTYLVTQAVWNGRWQLCAALLTVWILVREMRRR
ncbi:hypothetical protein ABZX75_21905 [Streptomyces sp. NPDC003038]